MIPDNIALLMAETGCDQAEAELALEMCGYEVELAVKAIPRLLKNIVVLKGKFIAPELNQFGLLLVILNIKTRKLVRSRAVLSYNPAVYAVSLDRDWFEFEKHLYGCRLWEGSLQTESLEVEQSLAHHFRAGAAAGAKDDILSALKKLLRGQAVELKLKEDVLDLGQFQSLRSDPAPAGKARRASQAWKEQGLLILKVSLEEDPAGIPAGELRAGDMVGAVIKDPRDIAQYLSKLFGGHSEAGPAPILAPVEAIEGDAAGLLARVRFSVGVCGDAVLPTDGRFKVVRGTGAQENVSWWRRFFKS